MKTNFQRHYQIKKYFLSIVRIALISILIFSTCLCFLSCTNTQKKFDELMTKGKAEFKKADNPPCGSTDSTFSWESGFTKAIQYFEEAVKLNPNNAEAHYFLGYGYDRLYCTQSPGDNIPNTKLDDVKKISNQFQKVIELNPKYAGENELEGPYSKLTGEWGSLAMAYILRGKIDSAKSAFTAGRRAGGFTEAELEFGKNLLSSCEPNAILFVYLDHETFPAWYLQLIEKYRTDVTVCNASLLNTSWYIIACKNGNVLNDNKIGLSLNDDEIQNLRPMEFSESTYELSVPKKIIEAYPDKRVHLKNIQRINWIVKPTFSQGCGTGGLWISDRLILDIIKSNQWERPIYFSMKIKKEHLLGLDEYLSNQGLVYKLTPIQEKDSIQRVDKKFLLQYLFGSQTKSQNRFASYSFDKLKDESSKNNYDVQRIIVPEYIHTFLIYVHALLNEKKTDETIRVLRKMEETIPLQYVILKKELREEIINTYSLIGEKEKIVKMLPHAIL